MFGGAAWSVGGFTDCVAVCPPRTGEPPWSTQKSTFTLTRWPSGGVVTVSEYCAMKLPSAPPVMVGAVPVNGGGVFGYEPVPACTVNVEHFCDTEPSLGARHSTYAPEYKL